MIALTRDGGGVDTLFSVQRTLGSRGVWGDDGVRCLGKNRSWTSVRGIVVNTLSSPDFI